MAWTGLHSQFKHTTYNKTPNNPLLPVLIRIIFKQITVVYIYICFTCNAMYLKFNFKLMYSVLITLLSVYISLYFLNLIFWTKPMNDSAFLCWYRSFLLWSKFSSGFERKGRKVLFMSSAGKISNALLCRLCILCIMWILGNIKYFSSSFSFCTQTKCCC